MDLDHALVEDARFLLDGEFLAALHEEMRQRLGREEASSALLQLGFLHGLRDASRVLHGSGLFGKNALAVPAQLAMRFAARPADPALTTLEIHGEWPEAREGHGLTDRSGRCEQPACHAATGYTSGWLSGLFDTNVLVLETECIAAGGTRCRFIAREPDDWIARADSRALNLLEKLPFRALRAALPHQDPCTSDAEASAFDPDSPAIHVWGPVMVIPFCGADETIHAVELIGRDAGARGVSVVVLDLAGTLVDEGFGALALERALEAISSWGAETILTGVSPLSEPAVSSLEQPHLLLSKDLHEAIATAFQVAEATRRPV